MRVTVALAVLILARAAAAQLITTSPPAPPPMPGPAAVMVIEDGGLDAATVRTVRGLTAASLRQRGVTIIDDKRFEGVKLPDDTAKDALKEHGATKVYALQMGRLGQKLILTLQELGGERLDTIYSASVSIVSVEETDRVLPRLAEAVLERHLPVDTLAGTPVGTIEPRKRKRGTTMGFVGLTFGFISSDTKTYNKPFGVNGSISYEIDMWRVDVIGLAESHGSGSSGFLGLGGTYLPVDGEISPYFSAALGYSSIGGSNGSSYGDGSASGMGLLGGAGVEFLRNYSVRASVGMHFLVPFYSLTPAHASLPVAPLLLLKVGFI